MDIRTVSKTLDVRLSQMPSLPPVAWPNVNLDPDINTIHFRVNNLPAEGSLLTMQYAQETPGVYQVTVAGPIGNGAGSVEQKASDLSDHFAQERTLDNNIFIESINIAPAIIDDVWFTIPVSINWRVVA